MREVITFALTYDQQQYTYNDQVVGSDHVNQDAAGILCEGLSSCSHLYGTNRVIGISQILKY